MKSSHSVRSKFRATMLAASVVAVGLVGYAPPAEAGHKHHNRGHAVHKHHGHRRDVSVPRVIRGRAEYGRFYAGRAFYAPHRHYHPTYRFPVLVNGVVVYRPYSYCGEHIFLSRPVALPRLAIGFNLGGVSGYYVDHRYDPDPGYVGCDRHGHDDDVYEDDDEYEYDDEDDD